MSADLHIHVMGEQELSFNEAKVRREFYRLLERQDWKIHMLKEKLGSDSEAHAVLDELLTRFFASGSVAMWKFVQEQGKSHGNGV